MGRPVHFEIQVKDIEAAKKFYSIFGWEFNSWGGDGADYVLIKTGEKGSMGIDGGMMKRMLGSEQDPVEGAATNAFVCTMEVDDLDEMIEKVKEKGGKIVVEKKLIPKIGWHCYCKDLDGNIFGMLKPEM